MRSAPSWRSSRPRPAPDLSRGQSAAHRRRAAVHRLHVRGGGQLPGAGLAAVRFRFRAHPPLAATLALSALIYANFFAHHFIADFRLLLPALTALLFGRAWVYFRIWREYRRMPLLLGFVLVALFIWFAENIGTFANAWRYPNQSGGWEMVSIAAGLLVPADDHQLCDGQRGEPPRGHLGRPCCRNAARGRGIGRIWRVPYFLSRSGLRLAGQ